MAIITATSLTTGHADSGSPSLGDQTTASITLTANTIILVFIGEIIPTGDPNIPTLTGLITWNQVASKLFIATGHMRGTLYYGIGDGSGGGLTIGVNGTNVQNIYWSICSIKGTNLNKGGNTIVQSATGGATTTTPSITLSAFSNPSNAAFGAIYQNTANSITPGSGYIEINKLIPGIHGIEAEYDPTNNTTVNWTIGGTADCVSIAVELKALLQGLLLGGEI